MNQLGIFGKYWEPGQVKTRLAASIGDLAASRIYHASLKTLLIRFAGIDARRILAFSPPDKRAEFANLAGANWQLEDQASGDLGNRMRTYFTRAFTAGATRIVLIGSDSPTMPTDRIVDAFAALVEHKVVLGPSEDGGYYLVGASGQVPDIFQNVTWSSGDVWNQTVARIGRLGAKFSRLEPWYDVDEAADLQRLRDELDALAQLDGETWSDLGDEVNTI